MEDTSFQFPADLSSKDSLNKKHNFIDLLIVSSRASPKTQVLPTIIKTIITDAAAVIEE